MHKNKHTSLLSAMTLFSPIVTTTLSISCWKINYEKDIKISFKRNKNEILASEILKYIEVTSVSTKVRYELSIVKADDLKGKVELMITPIYRGKVEKRFNLTFDGLKKVKKTPFEEILDKIQNVNLSEKETKTIDEYVSSFGQNIEQKIIVNGKPIQEFVKNNKLVSTSKLEIKNKELGVGILKIKFTLQNETKEITYEISGFKRISSSTAPSSSVADLLLEKAVRELASLDLVDKEKYTISQYKNQFKNNLKDKLKFNDTTKDLKKYLDDKNIEINNVTLEIISTTNGTGTVKFILKNKSTNKIKQYSGNVSGFKEDTLAKVLDEVLVNVSLIDIKNSDPEEYKIQNTDLKSKLVAQKFDNAKLVSELKTKKIEIKDIKIKVINYTTGKYAISITIKNMDSNEELTTSYEASNNFKSISIQNIVEKNNNIEIEDKNQTADSFANKYKDSQLKAFIKNFGEYENKFKSYGIELRKNNLSISKNDNSKIKLAIEYNSPKFESTSFVKEFEIGGFQIKKVEKTPKDAAEDGTLFFIVNDNSEYIEEVKKMKNWSISKNELSAKICENKNKNGWIIKNNNNDVDILSFNSLFFDDVDTGWKYNEVISSEANDGNYAVMHFVKKNEEITKILIKYKLVNDSSNKVYEIVFWEKENNQ
ncbi:hypothetical protein PUW87_01000 [Metamycoplasma hyosynoviae]|uniref:hypothetical protein n=1 Tax=Metamycoplasma hyosynoviae TaxID=29559 RepID=UPI0023671E2B|nr:hypothetical protein [Metamycoplasma hyosynoviae]MDD7893406.1 hypothetical protein [Metamycoplasma hyosynoviae]MDD7907200.1 hypothetical protein [Metamycoplasma hyosynoviae]